MLSSRLYRPVSTHRMRDAQLHTSEPIRRLTLLQICQPFNEIAWFGLLEVITLVLVIQHLVYN